MNELIENARNVIDIEARAVSELAAKLDSEFVQCCALLKSCRGKVILMGVGKSGHIANKIAATLASTGTSAFFVHPAEAGHGDLGMLSQKDVVLAVSYSGNSSEIVQLIPMIKRMKIAFIAMTGNPKSEIAQAAEVHLDVSVPSEACPHNLTPTASTTAALVMGDALAISLLIDKGFSSEDFARTHPSGTLGRRLQLSVGDIMKFGDNLPVIHENLMIAEVLLPMSEKSLGIIIIVDRDNRPIGVFTDGDLRRVLQANSDIYNLRVFDAMTKDCHTIQADKLAVAALRIMEEFKLNALPVVDADQRLVGAINMHTLLHAKII